MIRAVIDTNVLVSGLLSPAGNEALIVLAMHQGLIRPCLSESMMQEYAAVLARPKFSFEPDEIAAVLAMFRDNGEFVVPRTPCYIPSMTKLLDDALRAVCNLPPDVQDNIARAVLRLTRTDDEPPVALSVDERAAIAASKSAAPRGEFASDEQVCAARAKHGL